MLDRLLNPCLKQPRLTTFVSPSAYFKTRKMPETFSAFDGLFFDGFLFVLIARLFGFKSVKRVSFDFTSIAGEVFEQALTAGQSLFLVGSTDAEVKRVCEILVGRYPDLNLSVSDGYFAGTPRDQLIQRIVNNQPDFLVVGLGSVLQERFLLDCRSAGWKGVGYTCGAFISQTAMRSDYYPAWVDRYNLRWLWRMYKEPRTIKRYVFNYPRSVFWFLWDITRYKFSTRKPQGC